MAEPLQPIRARLGTRESVRIERSRPSNPHMSGYIVGCSGSLCMLHTFRDFAPDGYAVVRADDIVAVRCGPIERHWDGMLAAEGLLGGLERPPPIDLATMRTAIASADQHLGRMIIECEDSEEPIEDFYIGRVASLDDQSVSFDHFDALGCWTTTPDRIGFDEITMLEFETPYLQRFWKYLENAPRK